MTEPAEATCPTCGSNNPPLVRGSPEPGSCVPPFCPDTFHNSFPLQGSSEGKRWTIRANEVVAGDPIGSWDVEMALASEVERLREALKRIASYNADELRSWDEDNAADMVDIARAALHPDKKENP